jgi:NTP pyrophosphatase (non-canonical NTP hydrolase)
MTDKHARNATLYLSLTSDSGYSSGETHRISADQWERISRIVNEPAPACAPCQSCGAPVRHDTWLPDDLFAQISGDGGNGMFCPTCLVAKFCETFGWASVRLIDAHAPILASSEMVSALQEACDHLSIEADCLKNGITILGRANGKAAYSDAPEDANTLARIKEIEQVIARADLAIRRADLPPPSVPAEPLQVRIQSWATECFGEAVAADKLERSDRLLEEVFELLQAAEYPRERVALLASYVWSRPSGSVAGEIGDVMICIAAFASAFGIDLDATAETALARCWANIEKTRAKRAAKPTGSALPQAWAPAAAAQEGGAA